MSKKNEKVLSTKFREVLKNDEFSKIQDRVFLLYESEVETDDGKLRDLQIVEYLELHYLLSLLTESSRNQVIEVLSSKEVYKEISGLKNLLNDC